MFIYALDQTLGDVLLLHELLYNSHNVSYIRLILRCSWTLIVVTQIRSYEFNWNEKGRQPSNKYQKKNLDLWRIIGVHVQSVQPKF